MISFPFWKNGNRVMTVPVENKHSCHDTLPKNVKVSRKMKVEIII